MARAFVIVLVLAIFSTSPICFAQSDYDDEEMEVGSLRFNFAPLLTKSFVFDISFKILEKWTIGPKINFFNATASTALFAENHNISGYTLGVRGDYYPKGIWKTGWFVQTGLSMITALVSNRDFSGGSRSASTTGWILTLGGGYGWFWKTFSVGIGLSIGLPIKSAVASVNITSATAEQVQIAGGSTSIGPELTVGFQF